MGLFKNLRPISFEPKNFWTHRLGRQGISSHRKDLICSNLFVQVVDFLMCTGIHTIEHPVHQCFTILINRQHTGPNCAAGDHFDISYINLTLGNYRMGRFAKISPPVLVWSMLCPSWKGHQHFMPFICLRYNLTIQIDENRLRIKGAYVNTKRVLHVFIIPVAVEMDLVK